MLGPRVRGCVAGRKDSRSSRSTPAPTSRRCCATSKPDVVFNALHGRWGEDGCVQGLLEWLAHPLHPFRRAGLGARHGQGRAPRRSSPPPGCRWRAGLIACREQVARRASDAAALRGEAEQRGLVGRRLPRAARAPTRPAQLADDMPERVLVEEYVAGRELTTTVMGDRRAGGHRHHRRRLVRLSTRSTRRAARATWCRPTLPPEITEACLDYALRAHRALGCRGRQPHRLPLGRDARARRARSCSRPTPSRG